MTSTTVTARIPVTLTNVDPVHHGAGTAGNTALLRTQPATDPRTGEEYTCPYLSGSSLRHAIRDALAQLTLDAVGAEHGTLGKPLVDLLFSGNGSFGGGDGGRVDLDGHRRLDAVWPVAGLMGYVGWNRPWAGSLYVSHTLPVCEENTWRMPFHPHLASDPRASRPVAALIEEDFGTRRDTATTGAARWLSTDPWTGDTTTQMIFDWQVVKPGTLWYATLHLAGATRAQAMALRAGWDLLTDAGVVHLGAKRAQGHGGFQARADWPDWLVDDGSFVATLRQRRDEALDLLTQAAGKS